MIRFTPEFVVVGRVNKGKSSIVATLTEDDGIPIDSEPGTTRECRAYTVTVDGRELFRIVDTPGFQDAPAALEELKAQPRNAADRPAAVEEFVRKYESTPDFRDETRLLSPILKGGRILYVVDGSVPYLPNYEAEMEILRWTGRPRMALLNRVGPPAVVEEWKRALGQYFSVIREFDAHQAGCEERVRLLESFGELDDEVRPNLLEAVAILQADRDRRRREAVRLISSLLIDALSHRVERTMEPHQSMTDLTAEAWKQMLNDLREKERRAKDEILMLYHHRRLEVKEDEQEAWSLLQEDLFADRTWTLLGLSHGQMFLCGTIGGAALGGVIDGILGGASVFLGTVIGGVVGGGVSLAKSFGKLGSGKNVFNYAVQGSKVVRFGPLGAPKLPSILLDRALLTYRIAANRSHSVREQASRGVGIVKNFSPSQTREMEKIFADIRKRPDEIAERLREWLEPIVRNL